MMKSTERHVATLERLEALFPADDFGRHFRHTPLPAGSRFVLYADLSPDYGFAPELSRAQVEAIVAWCRSVNEWHDLIDLCAFDFRARDCPPTPLPARYADALWETAYVQCRFTGGGAGLARALADEALEKTNAGQ